MKTIYLLVKNGDRTYFNRAGVTFTPNKDGSVNFKLDMFPALTFQIREQKTELHYDGDEQYNQEHSNGKR